MITRMLKWLALPLAALVLSPAAMAQATRTWVSGVGDDVNPCSRTAPCKTFAGAISKTAVNGIINLIDSGAFGALTVTKSITIDGEGHTAGMLASGTSGVTVNGAGITVTLRNLHIEGAESGLQGVNFIQGARVLIENSRIYGFRGGSGMGVRMVTGGQLVIRNTTINDNTIGVHVETPSAPAVATLDNVTITDSGSYGVQAAGPGPVYLSVRRSLINSNTLHGVHAAGPGGFITLTENSISFNGGTAVNAGYPGASIRVSGNVIVDNTTTFGIVGGAYIGSDGTNRVAGGGVLPNTTFANQ
jgi:hypothetical protein